MAKIRDEDLVPNEVIRERYYHLRDKKSIGLADVARACDWYVKSKEEDKEDRPDTGRVSISLGITVDQNHEYKTHISYKAAVKLADALNIDYHELDI